MEHLLFEHIMGFELFRLKSFEGLFLESYADYNALTQVVTHVSALPLQGIEEKIDFINMESNNSAETLVNFLKVNGVETLHCDKSLHEKIKDAGINVKSSPNIMRGVKMNINRLLKTELDKNAVIGVAHRFSRDAIKYDMAKDDNLAIAVGLECEHLENEIADLSGRLHDMVGRVLPEIKKLYKNEDYNQKLEGIFARKIEESKHEYILYGVLDRLSGNDIEYLRKLNGFVIEKKKKLKMLKKYLSEKLDALTPNLRMILGDDLCVKMIHKAGGLRNLTLLPSSTVQLLGAEKSLFRSLKMKRDTPKYGILYDMENIRGNKGRMCRFVATKCSLAARIDVYGEERTNEYGKEIKKMIDNKMKSNKNKNQRVEKTNDLLTRVHKKICVSKKILSKEKYEQELKNKRI